MNSASAFRKGKFVTMWKPSHPSKNVVPPAPKPEPIPPAPAPFAPKPEASTRPEAPLRNEGIPSVASGERSTIGKGVVIKGQILGSESLLIEGRVEGSIELPESLVTVGTNGQIVADVSAREIVVRGKVNGNLTATERVEVRNEGQLTGDVAAPRVSIEEGAFFKGGIDIRRAGKNGEK